MKKGFLSRVYTARDAESTRELYDDWSASYDAEVGENGYATPRRCAEALAAACDDHTRPILDFGCGTGLSGLALKAAGFGVIDGLDLSADMLAQAKEKGVYRALHRIEAGEPLAHRPGDYAAIAAIGVIGSGAAPIAVFDMLMAGLAPGGLLVLSFNDHTLADPAYAGRVADVVAAGEARLRFSEHGDHLPGIGMKSTVHVLEKT